MRATLLVATPATNAGAQFGWGSEESHVGARGNLRLLLNGSRAWRAAITFWYALWCRQRWRLEERSLGLEEVGVGGDVDCMPAESPTWSSQCMPAASMKHTSDSPNPQKGIKLGMPSAFFGSN